MNDVFDWILDNLLSICICLILVIYLVFVSFCLNHGCPSGGNDFVFIPIVT